MREFLRRVLVRFIAKDVFHTLTADDVLLTGKQWKWKGRDLTVDEIAILREQALSFSTSTLWKVLKSELQWQAIKTLIEKGEDGSDIRVAQIVGYITQVMDQKLQHIAEGESQRG